MPASSAFRKVSYNPAGDSFIAKSSYISSQYSKNLMPIPSPNSLSAPAYMESFSGLKLFSDSVGGSGNRGIYGQLFSGKGWKVSGGNLYSFDSFGAQTSIGAIAGTSICDFASNATTMLICNGAGLYSCDGSAVTLLSLGFTAKSLTYINNQFVIVDTNDVIRVSDAGTTVFNSNNSFLAESRTDGVVSVKVFNQFLLIFGANTIEVWENTGVGFPPFSRINGLIVEDTGAINRAASVSSRSAVYFLGANKIPYRLVNFQTDNIAKNNAGITELFKTYTCDDAFLCKLTVRGQEVVSYHFPTDNKVWCYSENTGLWFALDHDVDEKMWIGKGSAWLFGKQIVGDRSNGNLYQLDSDTYQNNGVAMVRERVFNPLSGESLQSPRANLQMKKIQFAVSTGVGVGDDNPQMMVSYSTDGGVTYSNERWLSLGEVNDYQTNVEDYSNRRFKDLTVKLRYTENTAFSIGSSGIYLKEAGR